MTYDKEYILQHVKDYHTTQFTVFITEPLKMQRIVAPLPYFQGQVHFVANKRGGNWELTEHGLWLADNALEALNDKANFVYEHQAEFQDFYKEFNKEYEVLNNKVKRLRDERKKADYYTATEQFKEIVTLTKQRDSLYYDMYGAAFGTDAYYLSKLEIRQLINDESRL